MEDEIGMKHLRETFTDQEGEMLDRAKVKSGQTWHNFLLLKLCSMEDLQSLPEKTKLGFKRKEVKT